MTLTTAYFYACAGVVKIMLCLFRFFDACACFVKVCQDEKNEQFSFTSISDPSGANNAENYSVFKNHPRMVPALFKLVVSPFGCLVSG